MPESRITYLNIPDGELLSLLPASSVMLSSAQADWTDLVLEQLCLPPLELPENVTSDHLVTLKLSAPSVVEWKRGGRYESRCLTPGDVCLTPSWQPRQMRWQGSNEILALTLAPARVAQVAWETVRPERIELIETHGGPDLQIQSIGLALKAELEGGCLSGRLFVDALTTALAAHLLSRYNAFPQRVEAFAGGLPPARLRRAIEYIQDNLTRDLPLNEIAAELEMSASRFKLLFKQSTGQAPHQYVLRQRIERARRLLQHSELTPAQIAVQVGFYDQSHLTFHFKRLVGVTPGAFRKQTGRTS